VCVSVKWVASLQQGKKAKTFFDRILQLRALDLCKGLKVSTNQSDPILETSFFHLLFAFQKLVVVGVASDTSKDMIEALRAGFAEWKISKEEQMEHERKMEGKAWKSRVVELERDLNFCKEPQILAFSLNELWADLSERAANAWHFESQPSSQWPYLERPALDAELARYSLITLVQGRRRCGKTTLVRHVFSQSPYYFIDLKSGAAEVYHAQSFSFSSKEEKKADDE
jgi:hypothetical protein